MSSICFPLESFDKIMYLCYGDMAALERDTERIHLVLEKDKGFQSPCI